MTIEQAAQDLLETLDSMLYMNDFGGLQCGKDDAVDIEAAIDKVEKALAHTVTQDVTQTPQTDSSIRQWVELTRGEIMSMDLPADASVVDLAWAIEAKVREKNK
jgi:hypothetical protein